jgi:hypothetical protein
MENTYSNINILQLIQLTNKYQLKINKIKRYLSLFSPSVHEKLFKMLTLSEENIHNNSIYIDAKNILNFMIKHKVYCPLELIVKTISFYDIDNDGGLNYSEFCNFILPHNNNNNKYIKKSYNEEEAKFHLLNLLIRETEYSEHLNGIVKIFYYNMPKFSPVELFTSLCLGDKNYITENE